MVRVGELRTSGGDHRLVRHGRAALRVFEHCVHEHHSVSTHARIHGNSRHEAHVRTLLFELRVVREHVHRERVVPASGRASARRLEPIHTLQVRGEKGKTEQRTLHG